jgi:DNA-binding transcriptional ArsR family regulator
MAKKKAPVKDASALQAEATSKLLKAVADLDRLKILNYLRGGTKNVSQLAELLGAEIVNVSHHLGVLRDTKLVQDDKKGRFVFYSLHPDTYKMGANGETISLGTCRLEIFK